MFDLRLDGALLKDTLLMLPLRWPICPSHTICPHAMAFLGPDASQTEPANQTQKSWTVPMSVIFLVVPKAWGTSPDRLNVVRYRQAHGRSEFWLSVFRTNACLVFKCRPLDYSSVFGPWIREDCFKNVLTRFAEYVSILERSNILTLSPNHS